MKRPDPWLEPMGDLLARTGRRGGYVLCMPDYRPDLGRAVAYQLGLRFFDLRAEILMPLGWNASGVSLAQLGASLEERARQEGLVAHNVEALLATKDEAERRRWIDEFMATEWPNPVILLMFLFVAEVRDQSGRVVRIAADDLPGETLLGTLASWGS